MINSYVKIRIKAKNPNFFLKRYVINKIIYSKLKIKNNYIYIKILYEDYIKFNKVYNLYDIKVIKYYGPIKYKVFIKNNYLYLISLLISLVFLFLISNICFEINVIHNKKDIRILIKNELEKYNIKKFYFIPDFDKRKKVVEDILKNNKDKLEWMEIEKKGSKLIIKVSERKINPKEETDAPRDVIAKKNGIIKKIEASSGVMLKKVNDYVSKGDILITGNIIKDETVKGQVPAKGSVFAETWYKIDVTEPLYKNKITYSNKIKRKIGVKIFNKNSNNINDISCKNINLIKDKVFPFEINLIKYRNFKITKIKRKKEDVVKSALNNASSLINKKINKNDYIISKKYLNYKIKKSKIYIEIFIKVYEDITDYKNIDIVNIEEETIE